MARKHELYQVFMERIDVALASGHDLESSWYAYAVIEDRLRSLLRATGGDLLPSGKPIKMLGPKLGELNKRAPSFPEIFKQLDLPALEQWKDDRNDLTHAMAEGNIPLEEIDRMAKRLASEGRSIARSLAALARRVKKRQNTA